MTKQISDTSMRQAAILTGVSLILMAVAAIFATLFTIGNQIVPGDAAATTNNVMESVGQFRFGIFSWLVILVLDVLVAWGLYVYLKPVNKSLSLLTAWMRVVYAAILGAAMVNHLFVLQLISGNYADVMGTSQLQGQVLLFLNAFADTWTLGLIVFGVHLLGVGYLALKSGYIPRIFAILLIIAFAGYFIDNSGKLFIDGYSNYGNIIVGIFMLPMVVCELGLGIWLLAKGKNVQLGG